MSYVRFMNTLETFLAPSKNVLETHKTNNNYMWISCAVLVELQKSNLNSGLTE